MLIEGQLAEAIHHSQPNARKVGGGPSSIWSPCVLDSNDNPVEASNGAIEGFVSV